jgi:RNA polymerase sigma-70 factor (ECF subfamily)
MTLSGPAAEQRPKSETKEFSREEFLIGRAENLWDAELRNIAALVQAAPLELSAAQKPSAELKKPEALGENRNVPQSVSPTVQDIEISPESFDPASENALVVRVMQGDHVAFEELYQQYSDLIYRFVYVRVEDRQTAEDIAANVFLKMWQKINGYKFQGVPFRAWLYRIARNAVIDHYRMRKETAPLESIVFFRDGKSDALFHAVESSLELSSLKGLLLNSMTTEQFRVWILKEYFSLSPEEISAVVNKRQGAVRALLMRARNSVQKIFEDHPHLV